MDPVKFSSRRVSSKLITVSCVTCVHVGSPKIFRDGAPFSSDGAVAHPLETRSSLLYLAEIGRCRSNDMRSKIHNAHARCHATRRR